MAAATSWVGQAKSFLDFAAKTFGVWAALPAMEGARAVNDAVDGPTGLAKVSAQVAASVLRHLWNAYEAHANKEDPQWVTWRAAWNAARDKVGGMKSTVILDKDATWGNSGALLVACMGAMKLEATKAAPLIVPRPAPAADHAWLREFMRTQTPPPQPPPEPVRSPPVRVPSQPGLPSGEAESEDGGGILPFLLLFLL